MKKFNKEIICYIVIGILSIILYLLKEYHHGGITDTAYSTTNYLFLFVIIYGVLKKNDTLINTMAIISIPEFFIVEHYFKHKEKLIIILLVFVVEFIKNIKIEIEK